MQTDVWPIRGVAQHPTMSPEHYTEVRLIHCRHRHGYICVFSGQRSLLYCGTLNVKAYHDFVI